jgi:hypothetical protein
MAVPDRIKITHQRPMITPTIRAALNTFQRAANRGTAVYLSPELVRELREALGAEPEGEGPSLADVDELCEEFGFHLDDDQGEGLEILRDMITAAIARWHGPAAPPPLEPGDVPSDELMEQWKEECKRLSVESNYAIPASSFMAQRVVAWARQQQSTELDALRGVAVAVSESEDGFMSGVCAALATVTAHGDSVIWREIVRSVGIDNALNYAANVNPEDWELAGFSKYAQPELGKDKPPPAPQAGEVQPPHPTYLDAIRLAQGCHDYQGGHSGQQGEAFQDGVGTVVTVLKRAAVGPWDSQTKAVFGVGSAPQAGEGEGL